MCPWAAPGLGGPLRSQASVSWRAPGMLPASTQLPRQQRLPSLAVSTTAWVRKVDDQRPELIDHNLGAWGCSLGTWAATWVHGAAG